ncbi:NAD-dependent epimerase/dehydratase family protein [Demequina sp.]|uniref:NAD-dependent epimerase/dehydratase family protein n=1 Tax=Demequina sp. TaxID=2050685 RepID=UPI0025BC1228|nr:NAD-dependent epimerase/dehydratase family protein [Demequina sp.]
MSSGRGNPVYEVAVVGAAGFLGGAIMRAFAAAGTGAVGYTLGRPMLVDGVVAPEARSVRTVVWCASRINPRLAVEQPHLIDKDRADLDDALGRFSTWERPPRIVIFSSGGTVYGPPATPPFVEDPDPNPVNDYGLAKLMIERHVRDSGLESVALRASNAYGPGQKPAPGQGVLAHWMSAVMNGEHVHVYGEPSATRDYVYVDDVARAAVAAHAVEVAPPIVNIGSGIATSLNDLLEALRPVVAPRWTDVVVHGARDTDTAHSLLDVTLAREALGWRAEVDIRRGVEMMWAWRQTQ